MTVNLRNLREEQGEILSEAVPTAGGVGALGGFVHVHPILPPPHTQTPSFYPQGIQKCTTAIPVKSGDCSPSFLSVRPTFEHEYIWHFLISPSYFPQITDAIAEGWFALVSLPGSGRRVRKAAEASLHPVVFPVLHFLWLWGWGFTTLVYLYLIFLWCKKHVVTLTSTNSTPFVNEESVWEAAPTELRVEKDR